MNAVEIEQVIIEQVETIKGKLDIADVEVQITIPTKMQIHDLNFNSPSSF